MSKASPRYAKALLDALASAGELDSALPLLRALANLPEDVAIQLGDSTIPANARETALLSAMGSPAKSSVLGRFAALLSARRRLGEVGEVAASLLEQMEARAGIVKGTVRAGYPLTDAQLRVLEKTLSVQGSRVELTQKADPAILGGFRIRMGSTILDATANNQLNQARRALLSA
jgi:F-type H+-transporting ATPase subunit delta